MSDNRRVVVVGPARGVALAAAMAATASVPGTALVVSTPMGAAPPDRLSLDKRSKWYNETMLKRGVGVRFKGVEKTNVFEYCVSEGWVRLIVGNFNPPRLIKLQGKVEPYWRA